MYSRTLTYNADGLTLRSDLFLDSAARGPRPGILVFPEAFGLGDHARGRARRLAEHGYVALACDFYGDAAEHDDMATVMRLLAGLQDSPQSILARAQASHRALLTCEEVDSARIAAIGYCFGGTMALELARDGAQLVATAGFHCGLTPQFPTGVPAIRGKVLACIGADDPSVDAHQRSAFEAEMRTAGADWQLHVYGGVVHSFTSPQADARGAPQFARYDAAADTRSWAAMLALFNEVF